MPIRYVVDRGRGRMHAVATGPISFDELVAHLAAEERDGGLPYPELVDARDAVPAFSPAEVRSLVEVFRGLAARTPLGPTAIVVSTDYAYGMLRMLEMLVDDVCAIRPFRGADEAEAWLAASATGDATSDSSW